MNWAKQRAEEIFGMFYCTSKKEEILKQAIAAELQRVADECAETADRKSAEFSAQRTIEAPIGIDRQLELLNKAIGAVDTAVAIRAKFPKEEE